LDPETGLASLADKTADALITDPPYGVNLGNHQAAKERREHLSKQGYDSYDDTPENFDAVVVPAIRLGLDKARRGLVFCAANMLWHLPKATYVGGVFLPSALGRNPWGFSSISHCALYGKAPDMGNGCRPTAIRSTESADATIDHPCPKPIGWMLWAVQLASRPGELILDPFAGSGTTGVACIRLGRRFIGWEKDPRYHAIAMKRLQAAREQLQLAV
jgi:DNA modification methylase